MGTFFALAQGSATRTVSSLRWESAPEAWIVFLLFALVAAFAVACYLLEPKTERRLAKAPLAVIRALLIVLVLGMLFRPFRAEERREVKNGFAVVALDTSFSMRGFKDRERDDALRASIAKALGVSERALRDMTRIERAKLALSKDEGAFLRGLAARNRVRVFGFDATRSQVSDLPKLEEAAAPAEGAEPADDGEDPVRQALQDIERLVADGQSTALGDSLQRILTDLRSERVAALILLSDGRSNAGSLTPEAVARRYRRKGVPIYAVGIGDPDPPRDLSLTDFRAPDVSLAGDVLQGSFVVRAQGYEAPREVRVRVKLDDLQIAEETGTVGGERKEWRVDFTTKVVKPGEYLLHAEVEADPDELRTDNNRNTPPHRLRVIDERIKVLYLEGYPRWEYRYLKNALVRDRHMEVQCLLFSADPSFLQEASPGVPSLRRVPSPKELQEYHVIILGDVDPRARDRRGEPVFPEGTLEAIRTLVKDRGGGLLMIAGEQAAPRLYAGTPIADLLPVEIDESNLGAGDYDRPYRPRLTREGWQSALLRLEPDEALNRALWRERLPDLYWYAPSLRPKPQAHVLAVHPRDRNQHGPYPLLAWQRYSAGTTFWLGFDETWRWRSGVGDKYPYRFYGQVIRFLSLNSFTRSKRFYITTDKENYDVGEDVRVRAELRDPELAPSEGQGQPVVVDQPDGSSETLTLQPVQGEERTFEGVFKPVQTGHFVVRAEPSERLGAHDVSEANFDVILPQLELQEPRMDAEGLERVAELSGGKYLRLDELADIVDEIKSLEEPILVDRNEIELWDNPWVFLLFFGLICAEWIGRKVVRLL
ncbi:MAG: VWA domain-containing protein [Planctomycetota bacterium]|nr:MAG: VWA domain-containing protein [Planctomycetota bacterium]